MAVVSLLVAGSLGVGFEAGVGGRQTGTVTSTTTYSTTCTSEVQLTPTGQQFGNQYFEPPSGILIPAGVLSWTNFRLSEVTNAFVAGSIVLFPFPDSVGANITVAIYLNGVLNSSSTTSVPVSYYGVNSSLIPSSNSPNSVFALSGLIPTVGVGTQSSSALNLNGTTISIAIISDRSIWLAGWTQTQMCGGTGPQFGESIGQLAGTYEASSTSLPDSLPSATNTVTFELQISGNLS